MRCWAAGSRCSSRQTHLLRPSALRLWLPRSGAQLIWRRLLERLGPQIDAGMPFVMLEPSCASVFRDELIEFLSQERAGTEAGEARPSCSANYWPATRRVSALRSCSGRKIVVLHGHCHQKALMGMQGNELSLLQATNAEVSMLDSGCCGMAGPFGFEKTNSRFRRPGRTGAAAGGARGRRSGYDPGDRMGSVAGSRSGRIRPAIALHLAEVLAGRC